MMKTHQINRRQSCREYHVVKARDSVAFLRMTRKRQMQRRNNINHATSAQHAPLTSHTHTHQKPKSAMLQTHQTKPSQSCREYRAIKAGDFVFALRMTRPRQMQRRNKINHATSAQHAPRKSHTHTPKTKSAMMKTHQINLRQSCREYHAFEARDVVVVLRMTRTHQMRRCKKIKKQFPYTRRNRMRSSSTR